MIEKTAKKERFSATGSFILETNLLKRSETINLCAHFKFLQFVRKQSIKSGLINPHRLRTMRSSLPKNSKFQKQNDRCHTESAVHPACWVLIKIMFTSFQLVVYSINAKQTLCANVSHVSSVDGRSKDNEMRIALFSWFELNSRHRCARRSIQNMTELLQTNCTIVAVFKRQTAGKSE